MSIILFGKKEQEMLLMAHVVLLLPAKCQRRRRWRAYFTVHLGRNLFGMYKIHRREPSVARVVSAPGAEATGHGFELARPRDFPPGSA
jgi:hypothetical protein